ncbi:hypothetical protein G3N57_02775 [Paraburkholderia sp. Se-20369]|nr:hypothetical protein [Paraburkholderia sp. Se-20369]
MTNQNEKPDRMILIDEAKYLMSGQSALHPSGLGQSPTAEEMANYVVDMLQTYAEVELTAEQRTEAARVVRSLPDNDASMERFVANCEGNPLLTSLGEALQKRLDGPWRLL